jgi:hypothetical protein
MEHVIIANTSTVIHMMPVLVTFIFANRANTGHFPYDNTGIGIVLMPVPVLASFFQQCQYQYGHTYDARTG